MNNPSPLVPQGSLLEQKNKSRARVRIAVFVVLAIHGIGLLALLMQGCKKEPEAGALNEQTNNPAMTFVEPTNAPPVATNDLGTPTNAASPTVDTHPQPPAQPVTGVTEYTVASGDNFSTLAKKFHVPVKAIMDANPGVEPTKLKVGQKLTIPAPVAPSPQGGTSSVASPANETAAGEQVYSVKSGDSLTKIASQFGTTVKAIRAANNLKTDKIVVGQKLKIPAKSAAPAQTAPGSGSPTGQ
jgi:LysM repeat protein